MSHGVHIENAVKAYGAYLAANHINLDINPGEFFTLLGPSGCGKTTLLRMIAGFNTIDEGTISFDDQVINHIPADKRNIGMVFQNYAVFPHLSVRENVAFGLKARKIKGKELEERCDEMMHLMQIYEYKDRMPSQLSGGQQQRVALARALVINPGVLLMDEPLSNLDAKLRVEMRSSIRKIQRKLGITTIYVTHDQEEALAISDRIAIMNFGKVMQCGTPYDIYKNPSNRFVAGFIGVSSFIQGQAKNGLVSINGGKDFHSGNCPEGDILVSIRPENASILLPGDGIIDAEVENYTFLGDYVNYELRIPSGNIIQVNEYTVDNKPIKDIGTKVGIGFNPEDICIFAADKEQK